jgi:hypothetical protein
MKFLYYSLTIVLVINSCSYPDFGALLKMKYNAIEGENCGFFVQ